MSENAEVHRVLGRLESKVDSLLEENKRLDSILSVIHTRISALEKDRSIVYGAAAVLAFIGSGVMWAISKFFTP